MSSRYVIDTSSLLDLGRDYYPKCIFPTLWRDLDTMVKKERLFINTIVKDEINKKKDETSKWVKDTEINNKGFIIDNKGNSGNLEIMITRIYEGEWEKREVRDINKRIKENTNDIKIIADAIYKDLMLITSEGRHEDRVNIPKIYKLLGDEDVREEYKEHIDYILAYNPNPRCINLLEFFRKEELRY